MRARTGLVTACVMALVSLAPAWAQTSTPSPTPAEQKPKTLWDEFKLFSYIEMGATFNPNGGSEGVPGSTSNGWTNSLRFYDIDQGYTAKDLSTALSFIVGPEISGDKNPVRWVIDLTANYTGISSLTLGFNFDYGSQANDVFLTSQGLGNKSAQWYGIAAYAAYDFLKDFRAALPQEWFNDVDGVRTPTAGGVTLFSTTATLQYNIWKGLYGRGEYRHDNANEPVYGCRPATGCLTTSQDTLSVSLFYKFF